MRALNGDSIEVRGLNPVALVSSSVAKGPVVGDGQEDVRSSFSIDHAKRFLSISQIAGNHESRERLRSGKR